MKEVRTKVLDLNVSNNNRIYLTKEVLKTINEYIDNHKDFPEIYHQKYELTNKESINVTFAPKLTIDDKNNIQIESFDIIRDY